MTTADRSPAQGDGSEDAPSPPLSNVRVVELAAGLAVAYCGKLFAQSGAEVIRIEPSGGDDIRRWGPFPDDHLDADAGGLHGDANAGKRSVALDITTPGGANLAAKVISTSQVLLTSWKTASRLPLAEPEQMRELFPRTMYLSISEFGFTGPYAHYAADSLLMEALAGNAYVSGDPDREPLATGVELADHFGAVNGWIAGLAALAEGLQGEPPRFIDVSILESLTLADDHNLVVYLMAGAVRRRFYGRILVGYPSDIMRVKDGHIVFVPGGADFATPVSKLLDRPDLATHELFLRPQERVVRWRELDELIKPWLESHTVDEVLSKAESLHMAFAAVPDVKDLLEDPHLRKRNFWRELPDGSFALGPGAEFSESPLRVAAAPPLGADTAGVLGLPPEEAALLWRGVES